MDLHKLRVFRSAATALGFTQASEELHISQSTVSLHIKELEQELGCQLFLRIGRKVVLTEAGRALLDSSERVLRELHRAEMIVREFSAMPCGSIRLGAGATTLMYRLRPVIEEFRKRYPQVELIIESGTTEHLVQQIWSHRLDLAILMLPVSAPSLRVAALGREELVLVVPRRHPAGRKRFLVPKELESLNFILYARDTIMQSAIDRWFSDLGVNPRVTMEMENIEAVKSLVAAGLGSSVMPACALAGPHVATEIGVARVKGKPLYRELGLATPNTDMLPSSIQEFASMTMKEIETQLRGESA